MEKVVCYYHGIDFDGKCSAAIVRRKYPDCELIGVDYPNRPDFEKIAEADIVIIVDFSFDQDDMPRIWDMVGLYNLVWIDHHKSALEKVHNTGLANIMGKRETGKAACELTWEYFFPDKPMPEAVRLLGRYDVWDKKCGYWDEIILPFQYGMRLNFWEPFSSQWQTLFEHSSVVDDIKENGEAILAYENQRNATYAEAMAFPVEFEGHEAWAINKALSNSKIFETFGSQERPLWILFRYKAGEWSYSLYSDVAMLDVSKIAVKYGGGGHAGAAGFKSDKYLLKEF
jgi:oligoribonuclease NrnB/cAMP/cGMP phosphodiesterase (DHH superfamily)